MQQNQKLYVACNSVYVFYRDMDNAKSCSLNKDCKYNKNLSYYVLHFISDKSSHQRCYTE